jgi:hypothetical protein
MLKSGTKGSGPSGLTPFVTLINELKTICSEIKVLKTGVTAYPSDASLDAIIAIDTASTSIIQNASIDSISVSSTSQSSHHSQRKNPNDSTSLPHKYEKRVSSFLVEFSIAIAVLLMRSLLFII